MGILLWPNEQERTAAELAYRHTLEDLQLQQLCDEITFNHYFRLTVDDLTRLWTADPEVIRYRQEVLRDFIEIPKLSEIFENLLDSIDTWESHSGHSRRGELDRHVSIDMWDFSFLESYLAKLAELNQLLTSVEPGSAGLQRFQKRITGIFTSEAFQKIQKLFQEEFSGYALPNRITIGFNLNTALKPVSLKVLRVPENGTKGRRMSLTPSAVNTARAVAAKAVSEAGMAVSGYVSYHSRELRAIKQDIIFYLSALKLIQGWQAKGLNYCLPEIRPQEEQAFHAAEMFNPLLVINHTEKIICNDIDFTDGGELLVLTGANQGGKTIFLQSVALTQWLFQLGYPVPCSRASISPAAQILTVFAPTTAGTANARSKGLLSEEAGRISEAIRKLSSNSLVFFNEPLNATSPAENLYISREVLSVVKASGARGIWVTHLYELAAERARLNELIPWGSTIGSIKIVVTSDETGIHSTYHIERAEPDFKSYAAEVLKRTKQNA